MARDFSDIEKQYSTIPLGSTSPILSPFVTVDPERISPLMAPSTFVKTFLPDTEAIGCPLMIRSPILNPTKKFRLKAPEDAVMREAGYFALNPSVRSSRSGMKNTP